jgi:hypothetical protein
VLGKLARAFHGVEPLDHLVKASEAIADRHGRYRAHSEPGFRKHLFRGVNRVGHGREIDDSGAPLERVKGAKSAVKAFAVFRCVLQRKQVGGRLLDMLARFDQKLRDELVHAAVPQSIAVTSRSLSRVTGLTR